MGRTPGGMGRFMAGSGLALLVLGFAAPANAETGCPTREVQVYFEPGEERLSAFSGEIAERIALEARTCPGAVLTAEGRGGPLSPKRASAIEDAFEGLGVSVIIVGEEPPRRPSQTSRGVAERSAGLRLELPMMAGG